MDPRELPPLLTTEQAAEVLNASVSLTQRLCREGGIPAVRVGKLWRVSRDALLRQCGLGERDEPEEPAE